MTFICDYLYFASSFLISMEAIFWFQLPRSHNKQILHSLTSISLPHGLVNHFQLALQSSDQTIVLWFLIKMQLVEYMFQCLFASARKNYFKQPIYITFLKRPAFPHGNSKVTLPLLGAEYLIYPIHPLDNSVMETFPVSFRGKVFTVLNFNKLVLIHLVGKVLN